MVKKILRLTSIIFSVFFCLLLFVQSYSFADTDVTDKIELIKGRLRYDRRAKTSYVDISLQNISQDTLQTPLKIIIDSITDPAVTLSNPDGTTDTGKPYFEYDTDSGSLGPGETTGTKKWIFYNPLRRRFNFVIGSILSSETQQNNPPVANAGPDQEYTLAYGQTAMEITLDGGASDDPDGTVSTYTWTGSPDPTDEMQPMLTLGEGTYAFSLTVTDNDGAESTPDTVQIVINPPENQRPVADAGENRTLTLSPGFQSMDVTLDGSGSYDPDGQTLSFEWSGDPNPDDVEQPQLTLSPGTYTFSLVVIDEPGLASAPAEVTINVEAQDTGGPPQLTVEPSQFTVTEGDTLEFEISAVDPDGDKVTLSASPKIEHATFTASPGAPASGTFTFTPDFTQQGIHVVAFKALDGLGNAATGTARITVINANRPPTLTVPENVTVDEGGLLTIPVTTGDPDGDLLTLTAAPLPGGAIFIPATGTITFAPDFEQAGTYTVTCTADDGDLSASANVAITVIDVPGGTGDTQLTLNVDKPENPTLQARTHITGTVNMEGGTPIQGIETSLITGLLPSGGQQGETLDVTLQGQSTGDFVTHFTNGVSQADFGEGITVNSLTVNSETELIANITIAPGAATGTRAISVTSGNETAISMIAFNVTTGSSSLTGTVVDSDTGQPIANAIVSIQGTNLTTATNNDGIYSFADIPSGNYTLIINPTNHELITIPIDAATGANVDIGDVGSQTTVFDPNAPVGATLFSVLSRGIGLINPPISLEDARQVVIDTIIAVGGTEAGVIDEYGNQLNPQVEGYGIVTAQDEHVEYIAQRMIRGESYPLLDFLYAFSLGFEWENNSPPSLYHFLTGMQNMVNWAWSHPSLPEAQWVIAAFNTRKIMLPAPPTLTPDTQLTPVQSYLLVTSWLAYSVHVINFNQIPQAMNNSFWNRFFDILIPSALADPPTRVFLGQFTSSWTEIFNQDDFFQQYQGDFKANLGDAVATVILNSVVRESSVPEDVAGAATQDVFKKVLGQVQNMMFDAAVAVILEAKRPRAPFIEGAEQIVYSDASEILKNGGVLIQFKRSFGDEGETSVRHNGNPPGLKYYYRLWRSQGDVTQDRTQMQLLSVGEAHHPLEAKKFGYIGGPVYDADNIYKLAFIDPGAPAGHLIYYIDVIRTVGKDPSTAMPDMPWFLSFLPKPDFALGGTLGKIGGSMVGSFNPANALTRVLDPMVKLAKGLRVQSSYLSKRIPVWVEKNPKPERDPADGLVIDPILDPGARGIIYVSEPEKNTIFAFDGYSLEPLGTIDAGFAEPHQSGLAINAAGELFSDNGASDTNYGGRLFKFQGVLSKNVGQRELAGTVNYYSFLLGYAHPTAVTALSVYPDQTLLVADAYERTIKNVDVTATYDPTRRVGHNFINNPIIGTIEFNQYMDLVSTAQGTVFMTSGPNVYELNPVNNSVRFMFEESQVPFVDTRGLAFDSYGTMYLSDGGSGENDGALYAIPITEQNKFLGMWGTDDCELDTLKILRDVPNIGLVRVAPDGRKLVFRSDGETFLVGFGISGRVFDINGNPLAGASVFVDDSGLGFVRPVKTNACGVYHLLKLTKSSFFTSPISITVQHPDLGAQSFSTYLNPYGHSFQDFVLDPALPPESTEPPVDFPTMVPPPDPQPTGPLPAYVEIEWPIKRLSSEPIVDPPEPTIPEVTLTFPVDGMEIQNGTQTISGFVSNENVSEMTVAVNGIQETVSVNNHHFEMPVDLKPGPNVIQGAAQVMDTTVNPPLPLIGMSRRVVVNAGETPSDRSALSGRLIDPQTRRPIVGATIEVQETGDRIVTDSQGFYFFNDLPVSGVTVVVVPEEDVDEGF